MPTKKKAKSLTGPDVRFDDRAALDEPPPTADKLKVVKTGPHYRGIRRFIVKRAEDVSGTSGVGVVAEGAEFSNGWCAVTWLSAYLKLEWVPSVAVIVAVHGHGGKTWVEYEDDKPKEH